MTAKARFAQTAVVIRFAVGAKSLVDELKASHGSVDAKMSVQTVLPNVAFSTTLSVAGGYTIRAHL